MYKKVTVFREKLTSKAKRVPPSELENEPTEFLEMYDEVVEVRLKVKQVKQSMKKWFDSVQVLNKAGKRFGRVVDSNPGLQDQIERDLDNTVMEGNLLIDTLGKRIALWNDIIKTRKKLADLRILRQFYAKKLDELSKKDNVTDTQMEKMKIKHDATDEDYKKLYEQLFQAIKYNVEVTRRDGPFGLIASDLAAFRSRQLDYFRQMSKLIGAEENLHGEVDASDEIVARTSLKREVVSDEEQEVPFVDVKPSETQDEQEKQVDSDQEAAAAAKKKADEAEKDYLSNGIFSITDDTIDNSSSEDEDDLDLSDEEAIENMNIK